MNIKQIHTSVRLGLNAIKSSLYTEPLDQEIDAIFNSIYEAYIAEKYDVKEGGFESRKIRRLDLNNLISEYSDTTFVKETNSYYFLLPNDFNYDNSLTLTLKRKCNGITKIENVINSYMAYINLNDINTININDFSNFDIETTAGSSLMSGFLNKNLYKHPEDIFTFGKDLEQYFKDNPNPDFEFFYIVPKGKDDDINRGCICIRRVNSGAPSIRYTFNGSTATNITFELKTCKYHSSSEGTEYKKITKIIQKDDLIQLDDALYNTDWREPYVTYHDGFAELFADDEFIITSATLNYIRKSKPVSLDLSIGTECSDKVTNEIIRRTISYFSSAYETPNYNQIQNEELKNKN